jgi:hypothetical protein
MYTTTVNKTVSTDLDFQYSNNTVISGAAKYSINQVIPTGTNGAQVNFGFSITSGTFLAIAAIQGDIELKANSTTLPTNTFRLNAGENYIFDNLLLAKDSLGANLATFSTLYVYNSGLVPATLRVDSLLDPTPGI